MKKKETSCNLAKPITTKKISSFFEGLKKQIIFKQLKIKKEEFGFKIEYILNGRTIEEKIDITILPKTEGTSLVIINGDNELALDYFIVEINKIL